MITTWDLIAPAKKKTEKVFMKEENCTTGKKTKTTDNLILTEKAGLRF